MGQETMRIGGVGYFPPVLPVTAMQSYRILAPFRTHWRPASCLEAQCGHFLHGWVTTVDESVDLGQRQAHYIRRESGRRFAERRTTLQLTEFTFEAGQTCFSSSTHRLRNSRPERFLVTGGDFRGNPTGMRREHAGPDDWVDDFANHQIKIADATKRG